MMTFLLTTRKAISRNKKHRIFLFLLGKNNFEKYKELFACKKLTVS